MATLAATIDKLRLYGGDNAPAVMNALFAGVISVDVVDDAINNYMIGIYAPWFAVLATVGSSPSPIVPVQPGNAITTDNLSASLVGVTIPGKAALRDAPVNPTDIARKTEVDAVAATVTSARRVTVPFASTIAIDASSGVVFSISLTGNATLARPTNPVAGQRYKFIFQQDATGGRTVTFPRNFKFPNDVAPAFNTAANFANIISAVYDGGVFYCTVEPGYSTDPYAKISNMVILGDSITNQHGVYVADAQVKANSPRGRVHQIFATPSFGRAGYLDGLANFGVSGESSAQILARQATAITYAKSIGAQVIDIMAGTNDIGVSEEVVWANLQSLMQNCTSNDIRPIIWSILERTQARWDSGLSTTASNFEKTKNENIRNRLISYAAANRGVIHVDPVLQMRDSVGDRVALADNFVDGLHPGVIGTLRMSDVGSPLYKPYMGPALVDLTATSDFLLANTNLTGTTGVSGAGIQAGGAVPTGWTALKTRGSANDSGTVTVTEEASTDGVSVPWKVFNFQDVVRAASDGNENWNLQVVTALTTNKYAPGDVVEFSAECRIWNHNGTLVGVGCTLQESDGNLIRVNWSGQGIVGQYYPNQDRTFLVSTPRMLIRPYFGSGGATLITNLVVQGDPRVNFTGKVGFRRVRVRKIV